MFIQVLVDDKIKAGQEVLAELRKARFPISKAFWCRIPDSGYWRLVIGSSRIDQIGPMEGYRRLHEILDRLGLRSTMSGSISLLSPNNPTYQGLLQDAHSPGQFGVSAGQLIPFNAFQDAYFYN